MKFNLALFLLASVFFLFSCGIKGNPKPPPIDRPSSVEDVKVKQVGGFVLVLFNYPKLYIDSRPLKEEIEFKVFRDYREIKVDIANSGTLYWFFDKLSEKQQCYEIIVKTKKMSSNPSKKVCIIPKSVPSNPFPDLVLENTDDGVLIKSYTLNKLNLYKVNSPDSFYPIFLTTFEGTFLDRQVAENTSYCYYYTFYLGENVESDYSNYFCITYRDTFPPAPATMGKLVLNEDGSATLIWNESSSKDVVGYVVYKSSKPILSIPVKTYYFIDKDYKEGDVYTVYAVDKANNKSKPLEIR